MASISSLGVGSNLDLSTLLTQLQTAESQPLVVLQQRSVSFSTKVSAYGTIKSALSTLQAAAKKLGDPSLYTGVKASVTAADVMSVTTSGTASAGTYLVDVKQLAQAQALVSGGVADPKVAIGTGVISIDFGSISGGTYDAATGKYSGGATFAADADHAAVPPITIDSSNNTLEGIRDAINKAKVGVNATIVNDGSGTPNRLVLVSAATGEKSSMRISVAGDPALQGLLGHDPAGVQGLQQTVTAQNAKLTVNGIAVTSQTNAVKEAVQGTTINVLKVGVSSMTATTDTASVTAAINDFVKAYNGLDTSADTLTAYDAKTKKGGALLGDSTLRNLLSRVRQGVIASQSGGQDDLKVLSSIGIALQKDGTLAVDSAKLDKALSANLEGVAKLFTGADGKSGFGNQISAIAEDLTGEKGALKAATDGINTTLKQLSDQYDAMSLRVDSTVERYRKQFTNLDVMISSMNNTMTYLTQQFAAMNGTSSK